MATQLTDAGRVQAVSAGSSPARAPRIGQVDYVGFEAKAQEARVLGDVISRMGKFAKELGAQYRTQEAQRDYVENFQLTQADLERAKDGDPNGVLLGNDTSVYGRTLKKMRAMQLAGMLEVEIKDAAAKAQIAAEAAGSTLAVSKMEKGLTALIEQNVQVLSQVDPEAAVKLTATGRLHAITSINAAYKVALQKEKERTSAAIVLTNEQENPKIAALVREGQTTLGIGVENNVQLIDTMRTLRLQNSFSRVGKDFMLDVQKSTDGVILRALQEEATRFVTEAKSPVLALRQLRMGATDNPVLNAVMTGEDIYGDTVPAWATGMAADVRKSAKEAFATWNAEQAAIKTQETDDAKTASADFTVAMANDDRPGMLAALEVLRHFDAPAYEKKYIEFKTWDAGGNLFADNDSPSAVKEIDIALSNPFGKAFTINDLYKYQGVLTKETFNQFKTKVDAFDNEQVRLLKEAAAARLGLEIAPSRRSAAKAADALKEAQYNRIINDYISARRTAGKLGVQVPDPLAWLEVNFDKSSSAGAVQYQSNLGETVANRPYKTVAELERMIRSATQTGKEDDAAMYSGYLQELRQAISMGLVDDKGNYLGARR